MITLDHLTKTYGDFHLDCTMTVRPGYVTGLIGKNGAGKSTTFKAILGLIQPDGGSGTGTVLGKPIDTLTAADRQSIGVVLSDACFNGNLTITDIVPILAALFDHFDKAGFLRRAEAMGLPLKKKISQFSTGMTAKLKVLIATSHGAKLLILDEPTAGLDPLARDDLLDELRSFMEEDEDRAVLISSHISSDLENLCDDLYMLHDGRIVFHEDTDVLLSDYAVLKVTPEQFDTLDKRYLLRVKKENYGYACLTDQKQYYHENHPAIVLENASIDDVFALMIRGDKQ